MGTATVRRQRLWHAATPAVAVREVRPGGRTPPQGTPHAPCESSRPGVGLVQQRQARFDFPAAEPFALELGGALPRLDLVFESYGTLNPARDNAILLVHALTGDAHAAGRHAQSDRKPGWWDPLIGPGRPLDTTRYCVICINALGGCAGSTGPLSTNPETGRPYGACFPLVTVADLVRAQRLLLDRLGVQRLVAVLGGSLGGMQALEWGVRFPEAVARVGVIAAAGRLGPQGIAFNEIGRRAIMLDPRWQGGDYQPGDGPDEGLALARMVGTVTYHSKESLDLRFGRRPASRPTRYPIFGGAFDVEGYLHHHGDALVARFDAHSYLRQTRAMDLYDVADGHDTETTALSTIRARVLALGIRSDWLFPPAEVQALAGALALAGADAYYRELDSPHGHDAFLKEWDLLAPILREFLN